MTPHNTNKDVAGYTLEELLCVAPKAFGIRTWIEGLTVCILDEPVRIGMMYVIYERLISVIAAHD